MKNPLLDGLNPPQQQGVTTTSGPVLILAGAGSGKTRVLTHRVAYLIQAKQILPQHILAITFTNKAAKEMKTRIAHLVKQNVNQVWVSTFHSLCAQILYKYAVQLPPYQNNFSIVDEQEQKKLLRDILKKYHLENKTGTYLEKISAAKNNLVTVTAWQPSASSLPLFSQIYQEYQETLEKSNSMDFDDLIMNVVRLWQQQPALLHLYQKKFQYLHVDEYQDTNNAQYQLIHLLAGDQPNLCVVGDSDQSIYSWRGANIKNILNFQKDYPQAQTIVLEQNYRSTKIILQAANALIVHNPQRPAKNLWTANPQGKDIIYYSAPDDQAEADFVLDKIQTLHAQGYQYSDLAILYRLNTLVTPFENRLMTAHIPYHIIGKTKFSNRALVKNLLAYLKLILNPQDDLSFSRIINFPKRNLGNKSQRDLLQFAQAQQVNLLPAIQRLHQNQTLTPRKKKQFQQFADLITSLQQAVGSCSVSAFLNLLIQYISWQPDVTQENDADTWDRILELAQMFDQEHPQLDHNVADFVTEAMLVQAEDDTPGQQQVNLMTIHAAKGLEFPIVFLVGFNNYVFPTVKALKANFQKEPKLLEEERRLAYVGITRAEKRLYLTSAQQRTVYGQTHPYADSLFLSEIAPCVKNLSPKTKTTRLVYVTPGRSYLYHFHKTCPDLYPTQPLKLLSEKQAQQQGYVPCLDPEDSPEDN